LPDERQILFATATILISRGYRTPIAAGRLSGIGQSSLVELSPARQDVGKTGRTPGEKRSRFAADEE